MSASRDLRAWTRLGDVEPREGETFLTFGYSGARPEPGTATNPPAHPGAAQAMGEHWLISGPLSVGLPTVPLTPLAQERPRLGLPGPGCPLLLRF